jgi:RimJ/RimL family protein N-acetyltransferase
LQALTAFAWTISELHRIELYIEPWNTGSIRVAESAGYRDDGLLRSHQQSVMPGGHAALRNHAGLTPVSFPS